MFNKYDEYLTQGKAKKSHVAWLRCYLF